MRKKLVHGVTVIEMAIYIAVCSIVMTMVVNYFNQSQNLTKRAVNSQESLTQKISLIDEVFRDLRNSKRTFLGSILLNGDFEDEFQSGPKYWATATGGSGTMSYVNSFSTAVIQSGFCSLSLQPSSGNNVTLDNLNSIKLLDGNVYLISGWVRSDDSSNVMTIILKSNGGTVLASTASTTSSWQHVFCRYPSSGKYVSGTVLNDLVKIQLKVSGGSNPAYFDNIALTNLLSVITSTISSEINIASTVSDMTDPNENVGFKFVMTDNDVNKLCRLRISTKGEDNILIKECFDTSAQAWVPVYPTTLGVGITKLSIMYGDGNQIPPFGKESSVKVTYSISTSYLKNQNIVEKEKSFVIFPLVR